jgi:hypothetical protein
MTRHILLPEAGTGTGNSLIRSLWADYPGIVVVGAHTDHFTLRNSKANRNYLLPVPDHPRFVEALRSVIEREAIDLLMPLTGDDVVVAAELRDILPCQTFLPSKSAIERCQDAYELSGFLREHGSPVAASVPVDDVAGLEQIFARFAAQRLWCQPRGKKARHGAAPVDTAEDARAWIGYWERVHGLPASRFLLSEILPGRAFSCQSLWKDGHVVLVKTVERLAHLDTDPRASATSALAAVARTVDDRRLVDICVNAIRALDPDATGAFNIDLRENHDGVPCVTDIDAGGLSPMLNFFDLTGAYNMSATYVRLALSERVDIAEPYDVAAECYLVRGVDTLPAIFRADELFDGIGPGHA